MNIYELNLLLHDPSSNSECTIHVFWYHPPWNYYWVASSPLPDCSGVIQVFLVHIMVTFLCIIQAFLVHVMVMFKELIKHDVFPEDWSVMRMQTNQYVNQIYWCIKMNVCAVIWAISPNTCCPMQDHLNVVNWVNICMWISG